MESGLLYGLVAAVAWGLTDVAAAVGGRRFGSLPTLAVSQLISTVVLLGVGLAVEGRVPVSPEVVPIATLLGLLAATAYVTFFAALRIGPVSIVSSCVGAYGGLSVILAVLLLGETIRPVQWVGAGVATVGIVLAAFHLDGPLRSARPASRGVVLAVVALVVFAVITVGLAGPIRRVGWLDVVFVERLANSVAVWVLLFVVRRFRPRGSETLMRHPDPLTRRGLGLVLAVGLFDVVGLIALGIGLQVSLAWLVGLSSSFSPAVAVLVAVVGLGERPLRLQWLGMAGIALGLVLVAAPG